MVKHYTLSAFLLAASLTAGAQDFTVLPYTPHAVSTAVQAADDTPADVTFGYYTGVEDLSLLGLGVSAGETVDLAIRISDTSLAGAKIKGISFYALDADVSHYTDFKVWISSTLTTTGTTIKLSKEVTVTEEGMYRVDFDTIYNIPLTGCYIGYSFRVNQVLSDYDQAIVMADGAKSNSFNIHTSRTYSTWKNYSTAGYGMLTLQAHLIIDGMPEVAVTLDGSASDLYAAIGEEEIGLPVTMTNKGHQAVTAITYDYTVGDLSGTTTADVLVDNRVLNCQSAITLPLPVPADAGSYPVQVQIKALNGTETTLAPMAAMLNVMTFIPKHRAVIEEYTGGWCGWCPRGAVAMHKMRELHPDDFIGICIHNGDAMEITSSFPSRVDGFPFAYIDRTLGVDPYYGSGDNNFGIEQDWAARCSVIAPADLDLTAEWDETETNIDVHTSVRFAADPQSANYRLAYVLVADSLYGTTSAWRQQNYYSQYSANQLPGDLAFLATAGATYYPYYEDVMVAYSTPFAGITGSVPADAVMGEPFAHSYTFTNAGSRALVQDKTKLEAIVLLINASTGAILNANKAHVLSHNEATAIRDIEAERRPADDSTFDLQGRSLDAGAHGLQVRGGKVILIK